MKITTVVPTDLSVYSTIGVCVSASFFSINCFISKNSSFLKLKERLLSGSFFYVFLFFFYMIICSFNSFNFYFDNYLL